MRASSSLLLGCAVLLQPTASFPLARSPSSLRRPAARWPTASTASTASTTATADAADTADAIADIEFPKPLTFRESLSRALSFWVRIAPVAAKYLYVDNSLKVRERILGQCLSDDECEVLWEDAHDTGSTILSDAINDLKGFYAKTGQIIATRHDLFPRQYTDQLSGLTDYIDPMDVKLVKALVAQELCARNGTSFDEMFAEFDDIPLGAATVAQVHRGVLTERFGGREVAIKVQRPSIEPKLMGDVANLKALAKQIRRFESIPVDYYTVFSELEAQVRPPCCYDWNSMQSLFRNSTHQHQNQTPAPLTPLPCPALPCLALVMNNPSSWRTSSTSSSRPRPWSGSATSSATWR